MPHVSIQPEDLFSSAPYGFSQVVVSRGEQIIYCAGQTANDKKLNVIGVGDLEAQLRASLENVGIALKAGGAGFGDVVCTRVYIVDYTPDYLGVISSVMSDFFGDNLPANTLIGVQALALPEFLCEIEATAVV